MNHAIISDHQVTDQNPSNSVGDIASLNNEQATFEEDNLGDQQKRWLARVRMCNATKTVDPSIPTRLSSTNASAPDHAKGKLMVDGCADTSIAAIGNEFVEVSRSK